MEQKYYPTVRKKVPPKREQSTCYKKTCKMLPYSKKKSRKKFSQKWRNQLATKKAAKYYPIVRKKVLPKMEQSTCYKISCKILPYSKKKKYSQKWSNQLATKKLQNITL